MKLIIIVLFILFAGCKKQKEKVISAQVSVEEKQLPEAFFPVTDYLKGQIAEIKNDGINPLVFETKENKTDSFWLKIDSFDFVFKDFINTEIDTSNLKSLFKETRFLDQSIPAYTWTYDPIKELPDSISLRHWDVYVNPETNKVQRIFIKKVLPGNSYRLNSNKKDHPTSGG